MAWAKGSWLLTVVRQKPDSHTFEVLPRLHEPHCHTPAKSRFTPTRLKAAKLDEELFDEFSDCSERLANLQLLDRSVHNEKRATLRSDWLDVHCPSPEARKVYCDRHQLGDVPEKITGFMDSYSKRRKRLLDRIYQLANTVWRYVEISTAATGW